MKRFILGILCALAAAAPALPQVQKDSLANLIQSGNRKAALERLRAGADAEAQVARTFAAERRYPIWTSSTRCWPRASMSILNSTCTVQAVVETADDLSILC